MSSLTRRAGGLHYVGTSAVEGLAVLERRHRDPRASVICVHGGLDRGGSFSRLARRLEDFDVIAYDRRGYQASRGLGVASLADHVADLVTLARAEAQRARLLIFGHSMGGVIALGAALEAPDSITAAVAYESPLPWILPREHSRPHLGADAGEEAEIFFKRVVSPGAWERLGEFERESRRLDGPALLADLHSVRGPAPYDLAQLRAVTAYAHGDASLASYYRALAGLLEERYGIREIEMSGAGHGAHLSNPDQLATLVRHFWESACE